MNGDCPICSIHKEIKTNPSVLYLDENWVVRNAPDSKECPGYLYLETRNHFTEWTSLGLNLKSMGKAMEWATQYIQNKYNPRKIYTLSIGEAVSHIHIHLIPHYGGELKGIRYIELMIGR